jgi:hypothetical protein
VPAAPAATRAYSDDEVAKAASAFFSTGAKDLSDVLAKVLIPGVEGSLYFVGGFGVSYVQRDGVALAPVRFGVGWRQGISLDYMNFSPEKRYNPL